VQGTGVDCLKLALALPYERRDECPGAVPILAVHDEIVVECGAEAAPEVARWLGDTLRKAVADVLGYEELAGEDVVEMNVIGDWGKVEGYDTGRTLAIADHSQI
jgi:DNA polymerase-1